MRGTNFLTRVGSLYCRAHEKKISLNREILNFATVLFPQSRRLSYHFFQNSKKVRVQKNHTVLSPQTVARVIAKISSEVYCGGVKKLPATVLRQKY